MELKLENGRYQASKYGGLETVSGGEELCQRIVMKLTARRGAFLPLPDYGSRLHTLLSSVRAAERETAAGLLAAEALSDEPGVTVKGAVLTDAGGGTASLALALDCSGTGITVTLDV